ncbi:unnamed protein product [Brachionus calyciflorus]|uniref:Uncharacterized protein n=1 Tax=Brachionus calyciflorus TaxID=104777 RepID=A0A813ZTP9_9BILA|nr:unnamed protein product [Brachionus calyciflorus]
MNFILSVTLLALSLSVNIECQPLADSKNNFVNFFVEMLNPSFRRHRARLRPFTNQLGSPVINIRGTRDVEKTLRNVEVSSAECVYSLESLICVGMNKNGSEIHTECDANLNLSSTYENYDNFWLTGLKLVNLPTSIKAKFNLHAQADNKFKLKDNVQFGERTTVEIFSLHLKNDLKEYGIEVNDSKCWSKMIDFFNSLKENDLERIEYRNKVNTIASIKVL